MSLKNKLKNNNLTIGSWIMMNDPISVEVMALAGFEWLVIDIEHTSIDLFAGVGSFGLECLSRNASSVTFVESHKQATSILKKNIKNMNFSNSSEIIEKDVFDQFDFKDLKKKYDIIFADPPYKEKKVNYIVAKIFEEKIINKNGVLIIQRHKNEIEEFPKIFNIIEEKIYGISKIFFGNFD